jgi:dTDP-L-rhamnose 4-epimerase
MNLGNVLVTGGAGFIGSSLAQAFSEHSKRWVIVDNLHPQVHVNQTRPIFLNEQAELFVGDVTNNEDWDRILGEYSPDVVIHLAAETGTSQSMSEASRHGLVNVVGTTQLVDALGKSRNKPTKIILASSRAVYGEGKWRNDRGAVVYPEIRNHEQLENHQWDFPNLTPEASNAEDTRTIPTSVYGSTKLAQENILKSWCAANSVSLTVLRLQNVYGPGQSLINAYTGIISLFSQLARNKQVIPLYEDGEIIRDFVYISDVAEMFGKVLSSKPTSNYETFDIGSGGPSSIMSVADWISNFYSSPKPEVTGLFREGDIRYSVANIEKAKKIYGWSPSVGLEEGLNKLQSWIQEQLEPLK